MHSPTADLVKFSLKLPLKMPSLQLIEASTPGLKTALILTTTKNKGSVLSGSPQSTRATDQSSRRGCPGRGQHFAGAAWGTGGAAPAPSQCGTAGWIPGAAGAANPAAGARHVWRGGGAGEQGEEREGPSP